MSDSHGEAPHGHGAHEYKDVKLKGILVFTAVLVLVTIAIQLSLGLWMAIYSNVEKEEAGRRMPRLTQDGGQVPGPLLQGNPGFDTARYMKKEMRELDSYGWTDKEQKIARIPIERAMEKLLENKDLATQTEAGSAAK